MALASIHNCIQACFVAWIVSFLAILPLIRMIDFRPDDQICRIEWDADNETCELSFFGMKLYSVCEPAANYTVISNDTKGTLSILVNV